MKRVLALCILTAAALSLCGCSLYDSEAGDDISKFVRPSEADILEIIPEESAAQQDITDSSQQTLSPKEIQDELMASAETTAGSFTLDEPVLNEGYLHCGSFKFQVPALWQDRMLVEVTTEDLSGYLVTTYRFYYVQQEPEVNALMMSIKVMPYDYFYSHGVPSATNILSDQNTELEYFLMAPEETLPEEFTEMNVYSAIYSALASYEEPISLL